MCCSARMSLYCWSSRMCRSLWMRAGASTFSRRASFGTRQGLPSCGPTTPSFTNIWVCRRGHSCRADLDPDSKRGRHWYDSGARRLGVDLDLWYHGCGQLRAWRALYAGRLCRRLGFSGNRRFLDCPRCSNVPRRLAWRSNLSDDIAAAAWPRPALHDPRDVWRFARAAELRTVAVRPGGAEDRRAVHRPVHALLPALSVVPDSDCIAVRRDHRRALAFSQIRHLGGLDPRDDARPRHGAGDGHSGAVGIGRRIRDRCRHGGRQRRAVRPARRRQSCYGPRLGIEGVHRRRGRRHGKPGRLDRRRNLHQPSRSLRIALGEPRAGGHCFVRRPDFDLAVPADGPLRADLAMNRRRRAIYWTGFSAILVLLIVAPLVLPEFWRRFLTEILIWGLLAMSSDILIGYTGMISFGHSAFFGLGMYGAAAALISVQPPNLWLAMLYGLVGAAVVAGFVAYFSTRLRDIYFAITTLIFSQIFYVVIFTWTEVTGGENGLIFSRPHFTIPLLYDTRFSTATLHWFVLVVVAGSYVLLRRIMQSPFGMVLQSIRENEARTRAIGYPVERYKIVAVMLSGLFAGLAGVLYAVQNQFAAADFVFFTTSGDTVIFNVMGGIGTLVGPIVGAGFFQLIRDLFSRFFGDQFPYLIPLGMIFIVMIIFLPQGLLGFARRWLNR